MVEIVLLGLNDVGAWVNDWLGDRDDADVLGIATRPDQLSLIDSLEPDLVISSGFRHVVPGEFLEVPHLGAINFHKSYLPHNRGANPNVWSIVGDAPAGVSLHYMTADVDAGPIVDRRKVPVYPDDDGRALYERLEAAQRTQFEECWPAIRDGTAETVEQSTAEGSYHYKADFVDLWEIDRDERVRAGDFLDRLRALTFPPYDNAYFEVDGERYHVEVSISRAGEGDEPDAAEKRVPRYSTDEQP